MEATADCRVVGLDFNRFEEAGDRRAWWEACAFPDRTGPPQRHFHRVRGRSRTSVARRTIAGMSGRVCAGQAASR